MTRLYQPRFASRLTCVVLFLGSLHAFGQQPAQLASVRGTIRDLQGNPVPQASVILQRNDSRDNIQAKTDAQGHFLLPKLPDGVYILRATKDGYADAQIPSVFLKPGESKTVDLTIALQKSGLPAPSSAPQFVDQPQFTIAGVTDTTNLGGHGSDTAGRTRDSLAKDTVLLGESARSVPVDTAREKWLREAAERKPSDFSANHELGQLLLATGRSREAIPFLERASRTDPADYQNAYDLALANAESGNYAIAREQGSRLLATHDQADLHHLLGDVNEKLGDSLEAVHHYQRAAQLDPSEPHLFDWGAELLLHRAPEPATEVFTKGNRLFPSSARMLLGLGASYFARGAYGDAVLRISQASDLNPNDPIPYQFLGRIELSQITPSTGLVEKLHRFVTMQPQNADANYYYALGLWKLRDAAPEKASATQIESLLKAALQIDPRHARAALQLGIVHADQRAYTEAIADYKKAVAVDPQLEEAHYRLAQAYRQLGESAKAKEELRLYAQLAKESAQKRDQQRHEIKQFVYTLRNQSPPQVQ
jgi:tetratricopeptide (TPR) repeat protein